jgi:hypothetical protein
VARVECGKGGNRLGFVQGANVVLLSTIYYPLQTTVYRSCRHIVDLKQHVKTIAAQLRCCNLLFSQLVVHSLIQTEMLRLPAQTQSPYQQAACIVVHRAGLAATG